MSAQEIYFLSFLERLNPIAAQDAKKMEELIYEDPSSAIVKARRFSEAILNEVFKIEKIEVPYQASLYDKILLLTREEIIEKEIQQAFDIIRFSGNKAAHVVGYNDITEAFKLHKEMYKIGVWFFEVYSSEQIQIPLYDVPKPGQKEKIEDLVQKKIMELLGSGFFDPIAKDGKAEGKGQLLQNVNGVEDAQYTPILNIDIDKGESYLLRELKRLKDSAQEAIENANQFSQFKDYLHVDRKIQLDLEKILQSKKDNDKGNLILLCGSVGDGKSHLLAYLKEKKPELIGNYTIYNDATESFSPNKNAMETLEEVLKNFSDNQINNSNEKVILAINMGVMHNFIYTEHKEYTYNNLKDFIEKSDLFSQNITTYFSDETFDLLSFGDYHSYELTEKGTKSSFYSLLLKRILSPSDKNPFYLALKEDEKFDINSMVHENYKFLQNEFVQEQIVNLIIQTIVKKKLVISARAFLNFIADIIIPGEHQNINFMSEFDVLELSTPNLIFNRKERSPILHALSFLDPIHQRSVFTDQLVIKLNTLNNWETIVDDYIKEGTSKGWIKPFLSKGDLSDHSFNVFLESFIRMTYLTNEKFASEINDISYSKFINNLYYFNTGNKKMIKGFYDEVKTAIFKWKGSPKKEYIYLNKPSEKYRLAQKVNLRPTIEHLKPNTNKVLESFKASITLAYHDGNPENKIYLDIDFPLYSLLLKVQEGYRPNKKDEEDAIKFVEFIEKLMAFGDKKKELLVHFPNDNRFYLIKRDDFGAFVFEKE